MQIASTIEKAFRFAAKNPNVKKFSSKNGVVFENLGNGNIAKTIAKQDGSTIRADYTAQRLNSLFEQSQRGCFRIYPNGIINGITPEYSFSANLHGDFLNFVDRTTNKVISLQDAKSKTKELINYIRHGSTKDISVQTAIEYFKSNPFVKEFLPKQSFNNVVVKFEKEENGIIRKVVTQCDTNKVFKGTFLNGKFLKPKSLIITKIIPLENGKIRISYVENCVQKSIEAPQYLYHFTSSDKLDMIKKSGELRISQNEQVKGLYLLDSENFLSNYSNMVLKNGEKMDLLTGIFRQATDRNMRGSKVSIIRILTKSLLSNGKLLIRTQQDFFEYQNNILAGLSKELQKHNIKVNFSPRNLADDSNRSKFKRLVVENKLMTEQEIDALIFDMTKKLHRGYSFFDCQKLSDKALEYVYNKPISLSDFSKMGINIKTIKVDDFLDANNRIDAAKARNIF